MAAPGEDAVRELADYFADLRDKAGRPTFAKLAEELRFGKSTIHDAFRGYQPPSQDLAERLIDHLGGDVRDGMRRWRAARARRPAGVYETAWLTDLEDPSRYLAWMNFDPMQWFDRILAPDPGPDAPASERRGPSATVKVAWSALSWALSTAARILYNDNTDAWSASTLLILDRLIDQNHLPKSTAEAADRLHRLNVQAGTNLQADREGGPSGFVEISAAQAVKHVMVASSLITAIAKIPAVRAELEDRERANGELRAAFLREVEQADPSVT